jgi:signal-transduction protein with cAMP-binding, CBS, and nucleotidyltransferase domain
MQVKDFMTLKPSYCELYWTVEAVAALMDHAGTGILPVVQDALSRKLIGVVTDRDLCVRVVGPGQYPAHTWVKECMTSNPTCCHPEDSAETALEFMKGKQVRRLPVVNDRMELVGMLSISDFIRAEAPGMEMVYDALREISRPCIGKGKSEPVPHAA